MLRMQALLRVRDELWIGGQPYLRFLVRGSASTLVDANEIHSFETDEYEDFFDQPEIRHLWVLNEHVGSLADENEEASDKEPDCGIRIPYLPDLFIAFRVLLPSQDGSSVC